MRFVDRARSYIERFIDTITTVMFLALFVVALYALLDIHLVNVSAEMDTALTELAPDATEDIDLDALRKINPDIVGWLRIDGTKINYPVLQAKDNNKYLVRDYRGSYATAGSIFLDYRDTPFKNDFMIIYGHRMDGELMFGPILRFEDKSFFDAHRTGKLYTADGNFDLEISDFAIINVDTSKFYSHNLNKNGQNQAIIEEVKRNAKQSREVEFDPNGQILVLSTCNRDSKHYRDVLLTKMTPVKN